MRVFGFFTDKCFGSRLTWGLTITGIGLLLFGMLGSAPRLLSKTHIDLRVGIILIRRKRVCFFYKCIIPIAIVIDGSVLNRLGFGILLGSLLQEIMSLKVF